jgi:hypothetical protein
VPHCDTCDRFYNPNTLTLEGACPVCGRPIGEVGQEKISRFETEGAPWHFKLLIAITVIYLGYRFIQLIFWGFG